MNGIPIGSTLRGWPLVLILLLGGCAAFPERRGSAQIDTMLDRRGLPAPAWPLDGVARDTVPIPSEPLSIERALKLAWERSPRIRASYAELGIAQADVLEARRVFEPVVGYSRLGVHGGTGAQVTRSIAVAFADLLMLPARTRLARTEFERKRLSIAAELVSLATEVESAWLDSVTAQQVSRLRRSAAEVGETAGELANRLHAAGNLSAVEHARTLARAREARVEALRSVTADRDARAALATLLDLPLDAAWTTEQELPALPVADAIPPDLTEPALALRLDLASAREELRAREQAFGSTRRWRWLGDVEVGYERESDPVGGRLAGPTLALGIPLFHWNRAGVLRAGAELESARAGHAVLERAVRNEVAAATTKLATSRQIAEHYRAAVPLSDTVVSGTLSNYNYMLTDAFELLEAKQDHFIVFAEYLESLAEYWRARAELRVATGGALPPTAAGDERIGADDLLGAASAVPAATADPHAGHQGHGGGQ